MLQGLKQWVESLTAADERREPTPEESLRLALDLLAAMREEADLIGQPYRERLARLEAEQADALGALPDKMAQQERKIKELSLIVGRNVFGSALKAEYVTPSKTVDVKGLLGYALDHPGVETFISDGKPACRIKAISDKERKTLAEARLN